jgi:D-glycero-alpha-D-manno-heptose 1-phosphate guanylyltransferase
MQPPTIPSSPLLDIPAVLLVGGMGTRLRALLPSTPKPLASIGKKPFLELLVRQLRSQGIRHIVMCTGYLADKIEKEFGNGHAWDVVIEYSQERHPLGTAGAVKLAQQYLAGARDFLVMNGDSFIEVDFSRLIEFHRTHGGLASVAVLHVENASRYGTVQVAAGGRVTGFVEKSGGDFPGLVNAGVYIFNQAVIEHIPDGPTSLEKDIFPQLLDQGMYALELHGMFIDIGTPADYARAQLLSDRLDEASVQVNLSAPSRNEKALRQPNGNPCRESE